MHSFNFFRVGGVNQVALKTGADIKALATLDQKLWVALSCPTKGLYFDAATLAVIDADNDGQVRVPEILAAIDWVTKRLKNADDLLNESPELPLSAIADNEEGAPILASAKQILADLGKPDATTISAKDTASTDAIFAATTFNGDGVVPVDATSDEAIQAVMNEIMAAYGSVEDRSKKPGLDAERLDTFFADAGAFLAWHDTSTTDSAILALGDGTAAAGSAYKAVAAKVDDWFTRSRLAAFDSRAQAALNGSEADFVGLSHHLLSTADEELAKLPLAEVRPGVELPLGEGINPAWTGAMQALREHAIVPILGDRDTLSAADWATIGAKLAPYLTWSSTAPSTPAAALGAERLHAIVASPAQATIADLIARDKALEPAATAIANVDKLVRLHANLYRLLKNFTNFRDFYSPKLAIFQCGTLYLDTRSCELCFEVVDAGRHAKLAAASGAFLAYCTCTRVSDGKTRDIVAAITDGDVDNIMVGRNGLFYDRDGVDWHATITKVVDAPISIRQAFWAPYKRIAAFVQKQINSFAADQEKKADGDLLASADSATKTVTTGDKAAATTPPSAFDIGKFAGILAAAGLAVGAIGAAVVALATGFMGLLWWQMPLAIIAVLLLISGPSMLLAWLTLRLRNLGPILDANNWAINANTRINVPFGKSMTKVATLPKGSKASMTDEFAETHGTRNLLIMLLIVCFGLFGAYKVGLFDAALAAMQPPEPVEVVAPAPEAAPATPAAPVVP